MSHTPGPWKQTVCHGEGKSLRLIVADGPTQIARMLEGTAEDGRLIAAAPDMLAALKEITSKVIYTTIGEALALDPREENDILIRARAAIAKAEGK